MFWHNSVVLPMRVIVGRILLTQSLPETFKAKSALEGFETAILVVEGQIILKSY